MIALVIAVGVLVSGRLSQQSPNVEAGRIAYEADEQGRMRKVDLPAAPEKMS